MSNRPLVYLAGAVTGMKMGECKSWREYASSRLLPCYFALDPLRGKESIPTDVAIAASGYTGKASDKAIWDLCRWDVHRCSIVLANLVGATDRSLGTAFEMAWAYKAGKLIVTALETGSVHDHAFIKEASSFLVPTLDEAIDYIRDVCDV